MSPEILAKVRSLMDGKRGSFRATCAELARHGAAKRKARSRRHISPQRVYADLERRRLE